MRPSDFLKSVPTASNAPPAPAPAPLPKRDLEAEREELKELELERAKHEVAPCPSCVIMTRSTPFLMAGYCAWEYRSLPVGHANRRYIALFGVLALGTGNCGAALEGVSCLSESHL